jgi:hypothetical protein
MAVNRQYGHVTQGGSFAGYSYRDPNYFGNNWSDINDDLGPDLAPASPGVDPNADDATIIGNYFDQQDTDVANEKAALKQQQQNIWAEQSTLGTALSNANARGDTYTAGEIKQQQADTVNEMNDIEARFNAISAGQN